nr:hypothetical protein [Cohnella sp. CFH 77786]
MVFVPFHYGSLHDTQAANELTPELWDMVSKQLQFKNGAYRVEKLTAEGRR